MPQIGNHLFDHYSMVLTLGYIATLVTCMPVGFLNLDVSSTLTGPCLRLACCTLLRFVRLGMAWCSFRW